METKKTLEGKQFIIIGGTSGIGLETAKQLVIRNSIVTLVGRSEERCKKAIDQLKSQKKNAYISYTLADLSSLKSVFTLVQKLQKIPQIDCLIYCAAPKQNERYFTIDGLNTDWVVNFFAFHILLNKLLSKQNILVIYISSLAYLIGQIDFEKVQGINGKKYKFQELAYAASKRAAIIEGQTVTQKYPNSHFYIYDPGIAKTPRIQIATNKITAILNKCIAKIGYSVESTAVQLITLIQKGSNGELRSLYTIRGYSLPKALLPNVSDNKTNKLLEKTEEIIKAKIKETIV